MIRPHPCLIERPIVGPALVNLGRESVGFERARRAPALRRGVSSSAWLDYEPVDAKCDIVDDNADREIGRDQMGTYVLVVQFRRVVLGTALAPHKASPESQILSR